MWRFIAVIQSDRLYRSLPLSLCVWVFPFFFLSLSLLLRCNVVYKSHTWPIYSVGSTCREPSVNNNTTCHNVPQSATTKLCHNPPARTDSYGASKFNKDRCIYVYIYIPYTSLHLISMHLQYIQLYNIIYIHIISHYFVSLRLCVPFDVRELHGLVLQLQPNY